MAIFKKNEKWYIDYYFEGRRVRECVGVNKKVAEQALAIRKAEITQGKYNFKQNKASIKFEDFTEAYLEYSKANKKSYGRDVSCIKALSSYFKEKRLSEIAPWQIEKYKVKRAGEVAQSTVNRELECLKHMFTMAIKWGKAIINPVKEVKFFRVDNISLRVLTNEEEQRLLDNSSDHLKPIIITALNAGMRLGEILVLTWDKIDFDERTITVEYTKNREYRIMPMNQYLTETLKSVKKVSSYVFCKDDKLPYGSIKTAFKNAIRRSGILHCRFHDLRHTFATRLVMRGVDLVTVQQLLGHKSIAMTMRYSHPTPEHKRRAVELLEIATDGHYMDTKAERDKALISITT